MGDPLLTASGPPEEQTLVDSRCQQFLYLSSPPQVSRKGFGSRERMFFLFSDMLIYAKPNVTIERPLSPKTYLCRQVIPLGLCDVQLVLGQKRAVETGALFKVGGVPKGISTSPLPPPPQKEKCARIMVTTG